MILSYQFISSHAANVCEAHAMMVPPARKLCVPGVVILFVDYHLITN